MPARATSGGRRAARLAAVQALYQIELAGGAADPVIEEFVRHRFPVPAPSEAGDDDRPEAAPDPWTFATIVRGVTERRDDLDAMIASVLTESWKVERLEAILRAILRAGAYEIFAAPDVPAPLLITDYVDVAHAFFGGKEPGLVNGVLDRLAHGLRPDGADQAPHRKAGHG